MNLTRLANKRLKKMTILASRVEPYAGARVRAEVWNMNDLKMLSHGHNKAGINDYEVSFNTRKPLKEGTCAEAAAILKALEDRPGSFYIHRNVVLIARAKKHEHTMNFIQGKARPCDSCLRLMRATNVAAIAYTTNDSYEIEIICPIN